MENNRYYDFGYNCFGPFLFGFARWLKKELTDRGIQKVFFFSRDGYMMQKAFDLLNDTDIVSQYVYFSRKSLRQPLLHGSTDYEDSLRFLSWERYISAGKLLEYYGFDEAERDLIAENEGFSLEETVAFDDVKNSSLFAQLYAKLKDQINERSEEQDRLLLEYTEQVGMRGKFAIVDVGWYGNMQRYLEEFMKRHELEVDFEGFYVGILPKAELTTATHGYLYDADRPKKRKETTCSFGVVEKLLQGFEGSTSGYEKDQGVVVAKRMSYEYEGDEQVKTIIADWQSGALDYVKNALENGESATDSELTKPLIRFGKKPSLSDTKLFSFFYNIDGTKVYYTAQKGLFRYRPKELVHALSDSPWKTGFMKSVFKLPLPYYWVYSLLRK